MNSTVTFSESSHILANNPHTKTIISTYGNPPLARIFDVPILGQSDGAVLLVTQQGDNILYNDKYVNGLRIQLSPIKQMFRLGNTLKARFVLDFDGNVRVLTSTDDSSVTESKVLASNIKLVYTESNKILCMINQDNQKYATDLMVTDIIGPFNLPFIPKIADNGIIISDQNIIYQSTMECMVEVSRYRAEAYGSIIRDISYNGATLSTIEDDGTMLTYSIMGGRALSIVEQSGKYIRFISYPNCTIVENVNKKYYVIPSMQEIEFPHELL